MRIMSFPGLRLSGLRASVALAAMIPALVLAGCEGAIEPRATNAQSASVLPELPATLPLSVSAATPVRYAPDAGDLPEADPIPTVRTAEPEAGYAYADSAYGFREALGDAPPDYGFEYDGEQSDPWAWQGYDDSLAVAEPVNDGFRTYYYRPGSAQPYFVRDPFYGYGYDNGQLAAVYAADGGLVPFADYGPRIVYAARYLARGRDLYRASRERRRPVIAANWAGRRPALVQYRQSWRENRARQPQWLAYSQRVAPVAQRHWQDEAVRRQADARRYAGWQAQSFRTPPPPRAIPANWQRAAWAQDRTRFTPVQAAQVRGNQRAQAVAERRRDVAERRDERAVLQERRQAQAQAQAGRQQAVAERQQAQAARQQAVAERQQAVAARTDQRAQREQAQQARQAQVAQRERRQDEQSQRAQQRQAQVAQRAQREEAGERATAERVQRERARAAQDAQRQQAQAARAERPDREQAEQARAARQAERAQREALAAQRAQAASTQQAERERAQQTRAAQAAQQAERAQLRQARQAQAEQAQAARAAQQAERGQREQAQAAQAAQRAEREAARAAQAAQRQQAQAAREAQQAERGRREQAQAAQAAQRAEREAARAAQAAQRQQAQAAREAQQSEARQRQAERQAARDARGAAREQ